MDIIGGSSQSLIILGRGGVISKHFMVNVENRNILGVAKVSNIFGGMPGRPRGFRDLMRMAIHFQGAGEHW